MDSPHTNHMWIVIDHMDGAGKCKKRTLAEAERRGESELPMKILTRRNWKRRVKSLTPVSFFIFLRNFTGHMRESRIFPLNAGSLQLRYCASSFCIC